MDQKGNCSYAFTPNTSICDPRNLSSPRSEEEQTGPMASLQVHVWSSWERSQEGRTLCHQKEQLNSREVWASHGPFGSWASTQNHEEQPGCCSVAHGKPTLHADSKQSVTRKLHEGGPGALLAEAERDNIQMSFPDAGSQEYLIPPPCCQHLGNALSTSYSWEIPFGHKWEIFHSKKNQLLE